MLTQNQFGFSNIIIFKQVVLILFENHTNFDCKNLIFQYRTHHSKMLWLSTKVRTSSLKHSKDNIMVISNLSRVAPIVLFRKIYRTWYKWMVNIENYNTNEYEWWTTWWDGKVFFLGDLIFLSFGHFLCLFQMRLQAPKIHKMIIYMLGYERE